MYRFMKETVYSPIRKYLVRKILEWGKQPGELRRTFEYFHDRIVGPVFGICDDTARSYRRQNVEPPKDFVLKHLENLFHLDVLLVAYFPNMQQVATILEVLFNAARVSIRRHKFDAAPQTVSTFLRYLTEELQSTVETMEKEEAAAKRAPRRLLRR